MKEARQPEIPWQRLDRAFRAALTVSKEALLKEEAKSKKKRARRKSKRHD